MKPVNKTSIDPEGTKVNVDKSTAKAVQSAPSVSGPVSSEAKEASMLYSTLLTSAYVKLACANTEGLLKEANMLTRIVNKAAPVAGKMVRRVPRNQLQKIGPPTFLSEVGTAMKTPFQMLQNPGRRYNKFMRRGGEASRAAKEMAGSAPAQFVDDTLAHADDMYGRGSQILNRVGLGRALPGPAAGGYGNAVKMPGINKAHRNIVGNRWNNLSTAAKATGLAGLYTGAQGVGYGAGFLAGDRSGERQMQHLQNLGFGDRLMALYNPGSFIGLQGASMKDSNPNRHGLLSLIPGMGGFRQGRRGVDNRVTDSAMDYMSNANILQRAGYLMAPNYAMNKVRQRR